MVEFAHRDFAHRVAGNAVARQRRLGVGAVDHIVDADDRDVLRNSETRLLDRFHGAERGFVAHADDRGWAVGQAQYFAHLEIALFGMTGNGQGHEFFRNENPRFRGRRETAAKSVHQTAVFGWPAKNRQRAVTEIEQMAGHQVAGFEVVAQNTSQRVIGKVIFDQDERKLARSELGDDFRPYIAIVGDHQAAGLIRQTHPKRFRRVRGRILHVKQHLVSQPLRFGLKPTNDIAVENVVDDCAGAFFDQDTDCLRPRSGGLDRDGISELRDRGPDAFPGSVRDARFAANDEGNRTRGDIGRGGNVADIRSPVRHDPSDSLHEVKTV